MQEIMFIKCKIDELNGGSVINTGALNYGELTL